MMAGYNPKSCQQVSEKCPVSHKNTKHIIKSKEEK